MTNGQRMNQSVAPTSFMTSTSRRRANSDRRIVLEISRTEASTSSAASSAMLSFTTRVAERIFVVSSRRFLTSSIAGSTTRALAAGRAAARARRAACRRCRAVGRDAERVGQRVGAQQLVGLGVLLLLLARRPRPWRRTSTLPTCGVSCVSSRRTRSTSASVAFVFRKTSTRTLPRTSLAAPVVAWTIGMKTPSTSIVTSTDAIAANGGTALRRSERVASRRKNEKFSDPRAGATSQRLRSRRRRSRPSWP